jgi:hypothetical protein
MILLTLNSPTLSVFLCRPLVTGHNATRVRVKPKAAPTTPQKNAQVSPEVVAETPGPYDAYLAFKPAGLAQKEKIVVQVAAMRKCHVPAEH